MKWLALAVSVSALMAQTEAVESPALQYSGSPLKLPYTCTDDDLQWAGLACGDEPCPIYAELLHADGRGKTILVGGDFHAESATMFSLLLRSDDSGLTWREPFARVRGVGLEGIQMWDSQTAWVSGQTLQPLPLDPFFLVTGDGGKSWERVALFEEGTPGRILQFAFDSKDRGRALVDRGGGAMRFEIWETETGGLSWSEKTSSGKAPKFPPGPLPEWRTDPEPKLFRLEHLEEGHWRPFASFAIAAATCRPEPQAEPKEPAGVGPETVVAPATDAVDEIHLGPVSKNAKPKKGKPQQ